MNYVEKYKEAMERAKKFEEKYGGGYAALIFPELAESEDERIRKALIQYLKDYPCNLPNGLYSRYDFFTYLEKQKENPKSSDSIPSYCTTGAKCLDRSQKHNISVDDIAQDYVDGVKEYNPEPTWDLMQTAVCYGYHYREQEEQKSAESISQLTVQGKGVYKICPRCKERMVRDDSKVYTSMPPQYGYECPKCGEMEFDTIMYDNPVQKEQKPVDDKAFEEWIDDWYQGSKEAGGDVVMSEAEFKNWSRSIRNMYQQKPDIELIQRAWYMEGYHDREFGKEPKWIIKTGEGGPKHELNPKYGQPLTEQQVTEEQLHNLNEVIKSLRMDGFERIADSLHSLYNILKTQEQKPVEKHDLVAQLKEYLANTPKEQVEAEWEELKKRNDVGPTVEEYFGSIKSTEWSEEDEEMIETICKEGDLKPSEQRWLKSLPLSLKKKNDDIAKLCSNEWSEEDKEMLADISWAIRYCAYNDKKKKQVHDWFENRFKSLRPQPKQEWSKEDERMLNEITTIMDGGKVTSGTYLSEYVAWLKSLRPQPKVEWSEEDEEMLNDILSILHSTEDAALANFSEQKKWLKSLPLSLKKKNDDIAKLCSNEWSEEDENKLNHILEIVHIASGSEASVSEKEELESFLKSLRPQPKQEWSEEDKNKIESIKGLITMGKFVDTNTIRTIWELLDSLRPSWRPTEEQMKALQNAVELAAGNKVLADLYEHLKKL